MWSDGILPKGLLVIVALAASDVVAAQASLYASNVLVVRGQVRTVFFTAVTQFTAWLCWAGFLRAYGSALAGHDAAVFLGGSIVIAMARMAYLGRVLKHASKNSSA
jgi:hypothetical protein